LSNAGPNSGHTFYYGDQKVVLKQIPSYGAYCALDDDVEKKPIIKLTAGAIINFNLFKEEVALLEAHDQTHIDCAATMLEAGHIQQEQTKGSSVGKIASTASGVGAALADKVMRKARVAGEVPALHPYTLKLWNQSLAKNSKVLLEVSQGYDLSINSKFYPYCTSRNCNIQQALMDADIHPKYFRKSIVVLRTLPIRVGNTSEGHSGDWWSDQSELAWEDVGVEPELTTVTQRERRIATFSYDGYRNMLRSQEPEAVFLNFCNYLDEEELEEMVRRMLEIYFKELGRYPDFFAMGFGPKPEDVKLLKMWDFI
jgi:adenylosuccinate synthase